MPTKPTKKPTKPKRQNWKALASHRAGALLVMADVNRAQSEKITELAKRLVSTVETRHRQMHLLLERAEAAEKHNAILLAEKEKVAVRQRDYCMNCFQMDCDGSCVMNVAAPMFGVGDVVETPMGRLVIGDPNKPVEPPTPYERFQARTASLSRRLWDFIRRR